MKLNSFPSSQTDNYNFYGSTGAKHSLYLGYNFIIMRVPQSFRPMKVGNILAAKGEEKKGFNKIIRDKRYIKTMKVNAWESQLIHLYKFKSDKTV